MKTRIFSLMPAGHGHKKITILYRDGREYSAITDNMPLVDAYNSECYSLREMREQKRAEKALIRIVKERHGLR